MRSTLNEESIFKPLSHIRRTKLYGALSKIKESEISQTVRLT